MTGTSSKRRAPGLFLALALALACALGVATPAWAADGTGDNNAQSASAIATALVGNYASNKAATVEGNTITLNASTTVNGSVNITSGGPYTIDLNGNTITMAESSDSSYHINANGASLEIVSSKSGGKIVGTGSNNTPTLYVLKSTTSLTLGNDVSVSCTGGTAIIIYNDATVYINQGASVTGGSSTKGAVQVGLAGQSPAHLYVAGEIKGNESCGALVIVAGSDCTVESTGVVSGGGVGDGSSTPAIQVGQGVLSSDATAESVLGTLTVEGGGQVKGLNGAIAISVQGSTSTAESTCTIEEGASVTGGGKTDESGDSTVPAITVGRGDPSNPQSGTASTGGSLVVNGNVTTQDAPAIGVQGPSASCTIGEGANVTGGGEKSPAVKVGYEAKNSNKPASGTLEVTGGTVANNAEGGAAIENQFGSDTTVTGSAQVTGNVVNSANVETGSVTVSGGNVKGDVVAAKDNQGTTSVTGGNVTGALQNAGAGTVDMTGGTVGSVTNSGGGTTNVTAGTVTGDVTSEAGTLTVGDQTTGTGPTIGGNVDAEEGSATIYGGKVDGEVSGNVANQTPPPVEEQGTAGAVNQQVEGAVGPVESLMSGSATVTPSDDDSVWTVEITDGSMPVSTVAQNLVYQVVSALLRAGADPVTSVQDPNLAVEPGDPYAEVLGFCEAVLNNSVASSSTLPEGATLADLSGMECGVVATLADASTMSYTFEFTSGSEPGPNPPAVQDVLPVYRLYNRFDHLHLYTTDANEVATLRSIGWDVDFGGEPAWYAPTPGGKYADYEVVRLYNPNNGGHYFVRADDSYQLGILTGLGWQEEGSGASIWSAAPTTSDVRVYTLYNRFNLADTHLYTASATEVDSLVGPDAWEEQASVLWGVPQPLQ